MTTEFEVLNFTRERLLLEQARLHAAARVLADDDIRRLIGTDVAVGLTQLLDRQSAEHVLLLKTDPSTSGVSWSSLRNRSRENDRLLSECVALISGASTRRAPGLASSCDEAEIVARDLLAATGNSSRCSVIPADTECVSLASSVLRCRFPDHGIWDLPIVAHEIGHLVTRDLIEINLLTGDSSRPLAELLAGSLRQTAELAADVFAVYTIGPAYAMTLVLHRMDPTAPAATKNDATHPSDASRVAAVVHSLTLLDTDDGGDYDFIIDGLSKVWSNAQEEAPPEAVLAEDAAARVRRDVGKVWGRISSSQLTSARYTTFARARAIAEAFPRESDDAMQTSLDVVNAAWLIRYRSWRDGVDPPRGLVQWARHLLDPPRNGESH
jgi:hypothetical protein